MEAREEVAEELEEGQNENTRLGKLAEEVEAKVEKQKEKRHALKDKYSCAKRKIAELEPEDASHKQASIRYMLSHLLSQ